MPVHTDPLFFQTFLEADGSRLPLKMGDHHAGNIKSLFLKLADQPQHINIVCDPQISADFILYNILRADDNHDLRQIRHGKQHLQLAVRLKTGKHTGSMVIVKQLAAELQVQLVPEVADPLLDML